MRIRIRVSGFSGMVFLIWFLMMWVGGTVLAKGFWSTTICIFFFPWSFYLMVERLFALWGFL